MINAKPLGIKVQSVTVQGAKDYPHLYQTAADCVSNNTDRWAGTVVADQPTTRPAFAKVPD
ncbi:hypothetical protein GCM10007169_12800 [Shewanella fodinae]|nr:hypothetical protein GCM10007169_12800 [Shewanella fodinae]